ncbi:hypothetical protein DFJ73DRAFT_30299 [Zopfochytrium polystomum]|nr:hypothetical protein DFJ73DRAFT_30299 [Zopfochytrium polystomum]
MADLMKQSKESSNEGDQQADKSTSDEATKIYYYQKLPSSSVWCYGDSIENRVCRFRNLYYNPKDERFFIIRSNSSIMEGVPPMNEREVILEVGSVNKHPWTAWTFEEIHPLSPGLQNVPVRYETEQHILFKRFHPLNIMHNLHDDVIVLFHHLKQFIGGGDEGLRMPFTLEHRIQFIDPYDFTASSRPFQYLSRKSLRMKEYLDSDSNVITGFRDAIVGVHKLTTWYQYGFIEPQGPIPGKTVNGLWIREVAEWFCRRLGTPLGDDEDTIKELPSLPTMAVRSANGDLVEVIKYPDVLDKSLDFIGTDLIIILSRRKNRLILNEDELLAQLMQEFGFEGMIVRNEDQSFDEQIKLMRRARIVMAMHGSILIMTMFCRRGTVVLEMYPFAVPAENYIPYKSMAHLPGMDLVYRSWTNTHPENTVAHPDADSYVGGIIHLPPEEQEQIINTLTVPTHLCCTNPYWLYRIYQDTHVSIPEVKAILADALEESRRLLFRLRHVSPEEAVVLPPLIIVDDIVCLGGETREPGTLWIRWNGPWSGMKVDMWVVKIENGSIYSTHDPIVEIGGFDPGAEVYFSLKSIVKGHEQEYGPVTYCTV